MFPFMKLPYKWGIRSIHGFENFYYEFLQVVNIKKSKSKIEARATYEITDPFSKIA